MLIVDCFIFYNEFDLLTYRLNILNPVVDYFVLVEARQSFVGKDKKLLFEQNKEKYAEFQHKIIHVIVDLPHKFPEIDTSKNEQWINEAYQRNSIRKGIDTLNLDKKDMILVCDIDEIPDPLTLMKLKVCDLQFDMYSLEMAFYYYNLNTINNTAWLHPKIISFNTLTEKQLTVDEFRKMNCPIIKKGGWHLSYFGDSNFIKNKIENFSHQEFNNDNYTNLDKINERLSKGQDVYGRWYVNFNRVSIKDNTYLPPEFNKYLSKYVLV